MSYYGQAVEFDAQGRDSVARRRRHDWRCRRSARSDYPTYGTTSGQAVEAEPFSDDDAKALSEFGI